MAVGHHGFCKLCGHAHMEAGLKSELITSNPTAGMEKQLQCILAPVEFGTSTAPASEHHLGWWSVGSGDTDPVDLHAGSFVSMHACLRDLQADYWSPQEEAAAKGSVSNSDLCGHIHWVAGGITVSHGWVGIF